MLIDAAAASVAVDAFVPPVHPDFAAGIASSPVAERLVETQSYLAELARRGLLELHDTSLQSVGADPSEFEDGVHLLGSGSDKLARRIFESRLECDAAAKQTSSKTLQ
jgi:hypothetical protein